MSDIAAKYASTPAVRAHEGGRGENNVSDDGIMVFFVRGKRTHLDRLPYRSRSRSRHFVKLVILPRLYRPSGSLRSRFQKHRPVRHRSERKNKNAQMTGRRVLNARCPVLTRKDSRPVPRRDSGGNYDPSEHIDRKTGTRQRQIDIRPPERQGPFGFLLFVHVREMEHDS